MINFKISELINSLSSITVDSEGDIDSIVNSDVRETLITGIEIDSRKIQTDSVFIALSGVTSDGHDYLTSLNEDACLLAIVTTKNPDCKVPQLVVQDTRAALGLLAKYLCHKWQKPIVSITGSSGKTTTKFILNSLLNTKGECLCPEHSYNNDIGVPLSIFKASDKHWAGILELGTNHPGEIPYLASLIESNVSILANVSNAHIGNFADTDAILQEKCGIFSSLKQGGTAIILHDIYNRQYVEERIKELNAGGSDITLKTFGLDMSADCYADEISILPTHSIFRLNIDGKSISVKFNLLGIHQVLNALSASLAAYELGLSMEQIKQGLEAVQSVSKRMQASTLKDNIVVIDDSYNANQASVAAAIDFLAGLSGYKVLVLGDLGELGHHSEAIHTMLGEFARERKIDKLLAIGEQSKYTLQAFSNDSAATQFHDKDNLVNNLLDFLSNYSNYNDTCTILIKGSNFMSMWEVVEKLKDGISEKSI